MRRNANNFRNQVQTPARLTNDDVNAKGLYSRTDGNWQTRSSRRMHEAATFTRFFGLSTQEGINTSDLASTYMQNNRLSQEVNDDLSVSSTTRGGSKRLSSYGYENDGITADNAEDELTIYPGELWRVDYKIDSPRKKIEGIKLWAMNKYGLDGALLITAVSANGTKSCVRLELCRVPDYEFREFELWFMKMPTRTLNDDVVSLYYELVDTKSEDGMTLLSSGVKNRNVAQSGIPMILPKKQGFEWGEHAGAPLLSFTTNSWRTMPNYIRVRDGSSTNYVFPVEKDGETRMLRFVREADEFVECPDIRISNDAPYAMFEQMGEYVYYVDTLSNGQRFKIGEWKSEDVVPGLDNQDVELDSDADLILPPSPSIIAKVGQRLAFSGFKGKPNLTCLSYISGEKGKEGGYERPTQYPQYLRFYSPDARQETSTSDPIKAVVNFADTEFRIFRENGASRFTAPQANDLSGAMQITELSDTIGVTHPFDVTYYSGALYQYNQLAGMRRTRASESSYLSNDISNRVDNLSDASRYVFAAADRIHFFYDRDGDGCNDSAYVFDTLINYQSYPWWHDTNAMVQWASSDDKLREMFAMHSQAPVAFLFDRDDECCDFDSPVVYERHLPQVTIPGISGRMRLAKTKIDMIPSDQSVYIGIRSEKEYAGGDARERLNIHSRLLEEREIEGSEEVNFAQHKRFVIPSRSISPFFQYRIYSINWRRKFQMHSLQGEYGVVRWM